MSNLRKAGGRRCIGRRLFALLMGRQADGNKVHILYAGGLMADVELVLSESRVHSIFQEHLADCAIARNHERPFSGPPDSELLGAIRDQSQQLFIKHRSFATDGFCFKHHTYRDGGKIFLVDQFAGMGHLKMLILPLRGYYEPSYRLTIGYQSFFVQANEHIPPSPALKRFYKETVNAAKKQTHRLEVWAGRNIWLESDLLKTVPDILNTVRAALGAERTSPPAS